MSEQNVLLLYGTLLMSIKILSILLEYFHSNTDDDDGDDDSEWLFVA